ncbi:TadE family protein, partial [Pseudonocardia sp.]|uniref:TadE family protein n=1 Tax=Pseudonocardia sp. TaxID=60912 RepID=UPI003D10920E
MDCLRPGTADDGERGGATGVEMALLWVLLIGLILAVVQVALIFYAGQLALTGAQDG